MHDIPDNIDFWLLIEANHRGKHLTMRGDFVDCYSPECALDLQQRINDAARTRDLSTTRSDERIYYNGVLRVLRRRLREVEKKLKDKEQLTERRDARSRRRTDSSDRMLRLAGLL